MNKRQIRLGGGIIGHNIFERIISPENLFLAWREFRKGKRKKLEVQQFEFNLEDNLFQLHEDLKTGKYQPLPYVSFYICDPKLRHIHKAHIRDRVLHQAVFRILYPIFDKGFIFDSYSSRLDKGTHTAVDRLGVFLIKISHNNRQRVFALKCDIRKFFDSVDHTILTGLLEKKIVDQNCLRLLAKIIGSFEKTSRKGLPLGNITSQFFANIYLNELDQFIKHYLKIKYYMRYCDDFVILANKNCFSEIIDKVSSFLSENLKLQLHPKKIVIRKFSQGIDYLGYISKSHHRLLRTKTKKRILKRVNEKNLPSYLGVLKHCNGYKLRKKIIGIINS